MPSLSFRSVPVKQDKWKEVYAAFDPTARVEIDDQDLYVSRPGSVSQSIVDDLRLGLDPRGKWVVCGAMGSGKSSELVHLAHQLESSHAVIGLDLPGSVTRVDRLTPPEVLYLIGLAGVRAAEELWGHPIRPESIQELHNSFRPLLSESAREINPREIVQGVALFTAHALGGPAAAATVGGAARVAAALLPAKAKSRRSTHLGGAVRRLNDGDPDLERLQAAVDAVLAEIRGYRQPAVLVDGLDKIQELDAIRDLFAGSRVLTLPDVPVVYTGPITLMLATEWQQVGAAFKRERLSTVVVNSPKPAHIEVDDAKVEAGLEALKEVIHKRLYRLNVSSGDIFADLELERRIIRTSGGLMRDLIHLVQRSVRCCLRAGVGAITSEVVDEATSELRKEYEITLNSRRVKELQHVATHGEPSGDGDESAELLLGGYVLPYANGRVWFAPHPILEGIRPEL